MRNLFLFLLLTFLSIYVFADDNKSFDKTEGLKIYSPVNYQVFQRQTKKYGYMTFSGAVKSNIVDLKCKITGKDLYDKEINTEWKTLKIRNGFFKEAVKVRAGGWYKVQLKYIENGEEKIIEIEKVGIGEVIIGAGQSNSTNFGEFPSKQETGMVSSTDGIKWKYADDPMMGTHDGTLGGSLYPALGDALYREFHVPVGMASTGHGGTSIEQWLPMADTWGPNGNLFVWFMNRVNQLGKYGFRCVIWHQGENNVDTPTEVCYDGMKKIIESSRMEAGWEIPWFVAKVSYCSPARSSFDTTRNAHQKLWDTGVAFEGPDTDILQGDYRDNNGEGIHLSLKGLKKHGEMWAEKLIPFIHNQID